MEPLDILFIGIGTVTVLGLLLSVLDFQDLRRQNNQESVLRLSYRRIIIVDQILVLVIVIATLVLFSPIERHQTELPNGHRVSTADYQQIIAESNQNLVDACSKVAADANLDIGFGPVVLKDCALANE